mgnify:CR=1 FL=1|jgi:hypothetical protein
MRKIKIKTKEDNLRRNVAIIFLILLTFSTVGYSIVNSFSNSSKTSNEGFTREGNYWTLEFSNNKYYFTNLPNQLENITIEGNFSLNNYYSKPLYFTEENQGAIEILNNLQGYIQRYQRACIENCEGDFPIKNCSNNVIIFQEGENSVKKVNNCVYLSGDPVKTADKFLYEVLKIK